ncbi:DUF2914 domain-containing protein [Geothrix sp. PMB-07]|uniref:DUF2914 domain-containing protein n=1 Tax=Geothrix sp. PMB-07 TaxID=3068640 RepID=UPI0027420CE7|nr:DUF2914 domain-containing protein [Geothrix sp. PMB-07]WLT29954.1 DUF2914 domain-containing protein [Geothrix sp. PMB-07]
MRRSLFAALLLPSLLLAQTDKPQAELKTGSAVEKMELVGESSDFKVPAGTRIFVWAKVTGAADSTVIIVFSKGDKSTKQELKVPRSPYRTNAYRTFRKGDDGEWTVKLLSAQNTELGSATFKVEVQ